MVEVFASDSATELNAKLPIDALFVLALPRGIYTHNCFDIKDRDLVIIQSEVIRLGVHLLGQIYFSQFLFQKINHLT